MADDVSSPCIGRCTLDGGDLCIGCGRTIDEIMAWPTARSDQKNEIKAAAARRLGEREHRSGGC